MRISCVEENARYSNAILSILMLGISNTKIELVNKKIIESNGSSLLSISNHKTFPLTNY